MPSISLDIEGDVLCHCVERMLVFCALDAYRKYDLRGAELNEVHGDIIHRDHVQCINVMNARSPVAAWECLMPADALLGGLPPDRHLLEMSDEQWEETRDPVREVIEQMTSVSGIGLAAATKMLALKRPDLVPACDAQLVEYFGIEGSTDADKAVELMGRFRSIAQDSENLNALASLKAELENHELFGCPIQLSTTRILEALCWMETTESHRGLWHVMGWECAT